MIDESFFYKDRLSTCWHCVKFYTIAEETEYRVKLVPVGQCYRTIPSLSKVPFLQSFYLYKDDNGEYTKFVMVSYDEDDETPKCYYEVNSFPFALDFIGCLCYFDEIKCEDWRRIENNLLTFKP